MGLFGFLGKAIGGIVKTGLGVVSKVVPGPVGAIAKVAQGVLSVKHGATPKIIPAARGGAWGSRAMRGKPLNPFLGARRNLDQWRTTQGIVRPPASVMQASPVMPGGSIATPAGISPPTGAPPPLFFGGYGAPRGGARRLALAGGGRIPRRRPKAAAKKRKTRLKFGSPAWRKKYMKRGKKRRRAA